MDQMPDVDPIYHRSLFKVTDKLYRAYLDPKNITSADFTALLQELCSAFRKSIEGGADHLFRAAAGITNRPELQVEAIEVVKEARAFAKFIQFEKQALQDCGVSEVIALQVSSNVSNLREQLMRPTIDPDRTMAALRRFQDDVCAAAAQARADLTWRERRHKVKVSTTIASGFALSLANGVAIAKSAGAFVPFATLSISAGGAMVVTAGRFKGPGERKPG